MLAYTYVNSNISKLSAESLVGYKNKNKIGSDRKNITNKLPTYFTKFYELRKMFISVYER